VVNTTTFGAFVNLVPGRDGLIHISKLGKGKRLANVEDAVKVGDTIEVEVQDIDDRGKISLKPVGEEWAIPEGMEQEAQDRPPRRDRDRDRRPRDRDRRPRDRAREPRDPA
jgi:polyribonucleotide nucleotidyltransferase